MNSKQMTPVPAGFEALKQTNEYDAEYWRARDLQPLLGYGQWRRFEQAIERAKASCESSGNNPQYHFAGAGKPIAGSKGAVQVVYDYHLSRFACYLIAQNGYKGLYGGLGRDAIQQTHEQVSKDEIDAQRNRLIEDLESRLTRQVRTTEVFNVRWCLQ